VTRFTFLEYVAQMRAHRRRVAGWAAPTFGLPLATRVVLRVHDLEKWLFLPWLFYFHGGRGDRALARRGYDLMNRVADAIRFVVLLPFSREDRVVAKSLERVVDVVDRHMDGEARREFGQETKPDIANFLTPVETLIAHICFIPLWPPDFTAKMRRSVLRSKGST
jgi:hypothetical protein